METLTNIHFTLTEPHALALAQFVKRASWHDFRTNAIDNQEAYLIRESVEQLRTALAQSGFAPR